MQVLEAIGWFLSAAWDFFTEVKVPGFDFSFAALLVGLFLAQLGLRFLFMMLGISVSSNDLDHAERNGIIKRRTRDK